jgi:uncharacterized C2H2 Zn-finger protein
MLSDDFPTIDWTTYRAMLVSLGLADKKSTLIDHRKRSPRPPKIHPGIPFGIRRPQIAVVQQGKVKHSRKKKHGKDTQRTSEIQCPRCGRDVPLKELVRHLINDHGLEQAMAIQVRMGIVSLNSSGTILARRDEKVKMGSGNDYRPLLPALQNSRLRVLVRCPQCNGNVRQDRLERHLSKVHGWDREKPSVTRKSGNSRGCRSNRAQVVI